MEKAYRDLMEAPWERKYHWRPWSIHGRLRYKVPWKPYDPMAVPLETHAIPTGARLRPHGGPM